MAFFDRSRGPARWSALAALGLAVSAALTACSDETDAAPGTAAEESPAPVLGHDDDRIQVLEGTPYTLRTGEGAAVSLEIAEHGGETAADVVLTVTPEGGRSRETVVGHGDVVDLEQESWRVSELGFSDSVPGAMTLIRQE